jgi:hypothetical protein
MRETDEAKTAMRRLFASDRIMVESYGRPSQPSAHILFHADF